MPIKHINLFVLKILLGLTSLAAMGFCNSQIPSLENLARQVENAWEEPAITAYTYIKGNALAEMMIKAYGDAVLPQFGHWCIEYPHHRTVVVHWVIGMGSEKGNLLLCDMFEHNYQQSAEIMDSVLDLRKDKSAYRKDFSEKENGYLFAMRIYETCILTNSGAAERIHAFLSTQKKLRGQFLALDMLQRLLNGEEERRLVDLEFLLGLPLLTVREVFIRNDVLPKIEEHFSENIRIKDAILLYLKQVLLNPYISFFDMQITINYVWKWDEVWFTGWKSTIQSIQSSSPEVPSEKVRWLRRGIRLQ
jgi:hypothetical protein